MSRGPVHDDEPDWAVCSDKYGEFQCENGCCGDEGSQYCCDMSPEDAGAMLALLFGVLFCLALVASLIMCCCCFLIKQAGQAGRVRNTAGGTTPTNAYGPQTQPIPMSQQPYPVGGTYPPTPSPVLVQRPYPTMMYPTPQDSALTSTAPPVSGPPQYPQYPPMAYPDPQAGEMMSSQLPQVPPPPYPGLTPNAETK